MPPLETHFELVEHEPDERTSVIAVTGEIHVSTAPELSAALNDALGRGKLALVLDLSDTVFIDSTGLSVLLNGLRRVTRRNGRLAIVCRNPTVLRLFHVTRLDSTFDIHAELDTALARVATTD